MGQGAPTETIVQEFIAAYQRGNFKSLVALPPLAAVSAYGSGGYRQEFQDAAKTGVRFALVRPATPDLSQGLDNAVHQVIAPLYSTYTTIGVSVAGYPLNDTQRFTANIGGDVNATQAGYSQRFDKSYAIFIWDAPPNPDGSDTTFSVLDPVYTKWNGITEDVLGPPQLNATAVTSKFGTKATYQDFIKGSVYCLTSGTFSGRCVYLRQAVRDVYAKNAGAAGFLGLPISDETVLPNGLRRLSFEGGTLEYALGGTPIVKNAISTISLSLDSPLRLTAQQTVSVQARLTTTAGETVTDRDVFWTSSNSRVVSITGTGPGVTLKAVGGGTALVTATSEGKTSNVLTVYVASQCCAIGEGAPTAAITQNFLDAVQRNKLTLRLPISAPVRRIGTGYVQEAVLATGGTRVVLARPDSVPAAFLLTGSLLSAFEANGGFTGGLGYPTADASAGGTQSFTGGALSGSPVRVVTGAILTRWNALGADLGPLGPPASAVLTGFTLNGIGVTYQQFRLGMITLAAAGANAGRALVTSPTFFAKYQSLGGPTGELGAPVNEEFLTAAGLRQEYDGAFLDYSQGLPIQVTAKARKPQITVTPNAVLPGGRYRVAVGGFAANARVRVTQGSGVTADSFDAVATNGAFVWDGIVPSGARAGTVALRAVDATNPQSTADGSYTIRSLTDLRPTASKLAGDVQSGAPSSLLPQPLQVVVRDLNGNPLAGIPVSFVPSPGASVTVSTTTTNADGVAQTFFRLPPQAGVALVSAQVNGQVLTFNARVLEQTITDFPRFSQAVDGTLGNSGLPLSQRGSLLAAMASVVRFYQQRGLVPTDAGLADPASLNNYLKSFCTLDSSGAPLCDGFLDPGSGLDAFPNPWRLLDYSSGVLDPSFEDPSLPSVREIAGSGAPIILALAMTRNGSPAGTHFVSAIGVNASGDIVLADPNPAWNLSLLSNYLAGFPAVGGTWQGTLAAVLRLTPRGAPSASFQIWSTSPFALFSPNASCGRQVKWPAAYAFSGSPGTTVILQLQACDGSANAYQVSVPSAPFLLTMTAVGGAPYRSIVSGAVPAVYRVAKTNDIFQLTPQTVNAAAEAVVNAANFSPRLAAGTIFSIFGDGLPVAGENSTVEINGRNLPILFSNRFQLNSALPSDLPAGSYSLRLTSPFGQTAFNVDVADVAPGIFLLDSRQGAILNQDNSINNQTNPISRGRAIVIFATGLGAVNTGSNSLNPTAQPVTVLINGRELAPFYSGLAPGYIGLYQINVVIPANLPPGLDQDLRLRIAGTESNTVGVSIL